MSTKLKEYQEEQTVQTALPMNKPLEKTPSYKKLRERGTDGKKIT